MLKIVKFIYRCKIIKHANQEIKIRNTVRSERSYKSDFPIKCIYNLNFFDRKTVNYSQISYLFRHIFRVTARSDHLLTASVQRAARFLLYRTIVLKTSSSMFSGNLLTCRRRSHMFLGFSFTYYIGSKKNNPVVKGLANMVANDVACCER